MLKCRSGAIFDLTFNLKSFADNCVQVEHKGILEIRDKRQPPVRHRRLFCHFQPFGCI
jgi:hypothetical protein